MERVAVTRGEADAEARGGVLVEAALVQEPPGDHGVGGAELVGVELLGDPVRLDQAAALRPRRPVVADLAAVLVAQLDAVLVGQPLDGLAEGQAVDLHQEGDDVAALAAAEAVEEARGSG